MTAGKKIPSRLEGHDGKFDLCNEAEHIGNSGLLQAGGGSNLDAEILKLIKRKQIKTGIKRLGKCVLSERSAGKRRTVSLSVFRLREIEAVIAYRHGRLLPETDDASLYVEAVAYAMAGQDLVEWCRAFAPWAVHRQSEIIDPIILDAAFRKRIQSANSVADLLHVTMAERTALGLKTIGACDMTKRERNRLANARKRELDRDRQRVRRKALRMQDKKAWEDGSLSKLQPWKSEGVSRATWYRKRRETKVSRIVIEDIGDTFVSRGKHDAAQPSFRVEGRSSSRGPGAEPLGYVEQSQQAKRTA